MVHPQLKSALETLLAFPDMPYQEMSPPLAYYHSSRQEEHAEKFLELAADFVRAVHQQGGSKRLHERAAPFSRRTGPGSRYQELRDKAFKRLSSAFKQASPDGMAERLSVAELRGDSTSSRFGDVVWADVDKYLGDADSVLRFPSKTFDYCTWLIEFLCYPFLELIPFGYELRGIREKVEGTHLRGSFLLVAAHDTVRSIPQDAAQYRNLVETIVKSPETMAAAKAAAEDLVANLPVDEGQTPMATEKPAAQPKAENDYISLEEAGKMIGKHRTTATNKADKAGILEELAGHPVVSRKKWCEINGIDPDKPVRRKCHVAEPKAAPKGGASSHDGVLDDEIEDLITDLFDEHPGKHLSINEIVATTVRKYPKAKQIDVVNVLQASKKRGDYDQDDDRNWFRCKSE